MSGINDTPKSPILSVEQHQLQKTIEDHQTIFMGHLTRALNMGRLPAVTVVNVKGRVHIVGNVGTTEALNLLGGAFTQVQGK
jgi:hypothetical protein